MEQASQPFDYLLYAKLTSGTTRTNKDYQRDYLLTLELLNVHTGDYDKESETISKGYHHSRLSRAPAPGPAANRSAAGHSNRRWAKFAPLARRRRI